MKYLIILLPIICIISCKKVSTTNTIKGKYITCQNNIETPVANRAIDLFQQNNGSDNKSKVIGNTTTDAQGNFSFIYNTDNTDDKLIIRKSSGFGFNRIMSEIPVGKDILDLVLYNGRYNIAVALNVINPYTNMDTLYIKNIKNLNYIKKAGPFNSGRVYTEKEVPIYSEIAYKQNKETIYCGLNSLSNFIFNKDYIVENSKLCGDTVYVTLDIK